MKKFKGKLLILPLAILALAAFAPDGNKAIDTANFDTDVRPQDDFYTYVNGLWIQNHPVPKTESSWSTFNELSDKSKNAIRTIVETAAANKAAKAGTNTQRIGDFYASGMDSAAVEKAAFTPLAEDFAAIEKMKTTADLWQVMAAQHKIQIGSGFGFAVFSDFKNSSLNVPYITQSGTVLPDKDYYFSKDEGMDELRAEYVKHIGAMLSLAGDKGVMAEQNAKAVMNIETMFADSSMTSEAQRNIEIQYNKMTLAEISKQCPSFNWTEYYKSIGANGMKEIIVTQPAFIRQFNAMIGKVSLADWKSYFRWQLVHGVAGKMHKAVVDENFHFFGTVMSGAEVQQPRWKRVLGTTEGALGEALGEEYVKKHFSADAKKRVNDMVTNLFAAYEERIMSRPWMGDDTKKKAIEKLHAINRKLGYPDKWRDYTGLDIKRDSYVKNYLRSNRFDFNWMLGKMNKAVDKSEWGLTPQTINAYYSPTSNEIVFPAAIMQPPFFNPDADDAVNYGSIGAVIGHEITHGFDDQGATFDASGNLVNWWTENDLKNFNARTGMLEAQFNKYSPLEGVSVNGKLTLGENIADLGGLTMAYYAFKKSLEGKPAPAKIDGFTAEQRFFISWAQGWRNNSKPEALKMMVKTNPHSPSKFRVIGPLSNMTEFYQAFDVKEGDQMYLRPEARAQIW